MNLADAISIVEALAEGVDPLTGEMLPSNSPCHQPRVIRALYTVTYHLRFKQTHRRSSNANPEKAGRRWTVEEDQQLVREFRKGMPFLAIAAKHQRTYAAILARLVRLGKITRRNGSSTSVDGNDSGEAPHK